MTVQQISIFLENRPGQLRDITNSLRAEEINIRAVTVSEAADYGIIRLIVDETGKGLAVLKQQGFLATLSEVVAVAVDDRPGGLARLLDLMTGAGLNIEYMYSVFGKTAGKAYMVFKVDDAAAFRELLREHGIHEAGNQELGL